MGAMKVVVTGFCIATLLSGCAAAQRAMPGSTLSHANIISVLDTIDVSEIEAAQLAKEKASSEYVRSFAASLGKEHTEKMQHNLQLSNRMRVSPEKPRLASALESTHRETMEELRKKSGQDFDRAYIDYQVTMHEQAVKLVEDTANSVDDARLKQHLIKTRPDLITHLSAAKALQRQNVGQQSKSP
jgi:putative membrane protein